MKTVEIASDSNRFIVFVSESRSSIGFSRAFLS